MTEFQEFVQEAPLDAAIVDAYRERVPEPMIELWERHGVGLANDGFIRLIDPTSLQDRLGSFVHDPENCVPVFTTALADVVVWREGYLFGLSTRLGAAHALSTMRVDHFVRFSNDHDFLSNEFRWENYRPGAERLGVPTTEECLYYAPLLSLGGAERPESLRRGGLVAHLEVAANLQGRITIGPLRPAS